MAHFDPNESRASRARRRLSQSRVAAVMGISRQRLARWESGAVEPSLAQITALAALYEVPVLTLIVGLDGADGTEHPAGAVAGPAHRGG